MNVSMNAISKEVMFSFEVDYKIECNFNEVAFSYEGTTL